MVILRMEELMTLLSGKRKEKERKRVYAQIKLPTFQPTALAFFRANTCACMSPLVALGQGSILYICSIKYCFTTKPCPYTGNSESGLYIITLVVYINV